MAATVTGLDSITVGGLAKETGLSKSGILTVFPTREAIQVAAVAEARRIFIDLVVRPAWAYPPGAPRLRELLDSWVAYYRSDAFPGGCFFAAVTVEYGGREGAVAEAVRRMKREWMDALEHEFAVAGSSDPAGDAFRFDAYLTNANALSRLFGDDARLDQARRLALDLVEAAAR
jgi:AcrR family transcriptional regulator